MEHRGRGDGSSAIDDYTIVIVFHFFASCSHLGIKTKSSLSHDSRLNVKISQRFRLPIAAAAFATSTSNAFRRKAPETSSLLSTNSGCGSTTTTPMTTEPCRRSSSCTRSATSPRVPTAAARNGRGPSDHDHIPWTGLDGEDGHPGSGPVRPRRERGVSLWRLRDQNEAHEEEARRVQAEGH